MERINGDDLHIISSIFLKKKVGSHSRKNATIVKKEKDGDGVSKNWLDDEVHTLIALRGETEPKFVKNAKKQGMKSKTFLQNSKNIMQF